MKYDNLNLKLEKTLINLRQQFGETLIHLGKQYPNLVVLDADLSSTTQTNLFAKEFPSRFFNIGIAEQNLIGIANGLAASGKIPVVSGFACFTIGRGWEIIRSAAYDHLPLKLCPTHAGLSSSRDGGSHQSVEDLSLIAAIPGTQIFCPCDPHEVDLMLRYIITQPGVCYLRLMRNKLPWVFSQPILTKTKQSVDTTSNSFLYVVYESNEKNVDITVFSTGSMTCISPKIIQEIELLNRTIRFIHMGQIKPINSVQIAPFLEKTKYIITLEEHNIIAGFGAQLGRVISSLKPLPILVLGIEDQFGQSGSEEELSLEYGLTPSQITKRIIEFSSK